MKVVVLGTGDLTKIPRFTKINKKELNEMINSLGGMIAKKGHELIIVPDRGIPAEVAKAYKAADGKRVIGVVPVNDKQYGVKHLEPFLGLLDEKIEVEHWYDANGEIAAAGDICIIMGMSPGIMAEICLLKYHYRHLGSKTRVYLLKNCMSGEIPKEIEEEFEFNYINSVKELEKVL